MKNETKMLWPLTEREPLQCRVVRRVTNSPVPEELRLVTVEMLESGQTVEKSELVRVPESLLYPVPEWMHEENLVLS